MISDCGLLLFGGKGGVGKTSCAAASSLHYSEKGKKTVIVSTDPAHSLSDIFDINLSQSPTRIKENLYGIEVDVNTLIKSFKDDFGTMIKKIVIEGSLLSIEESERFFQISLPGVDELMALFHTLELVESNDYDLVILDTAPTGHTLRLLETPDFLLTFLKVLNTMREKHRVVVSMMLGKYAKDEADEFIETQHRRLILLKEMFCNAKKTEFIPVTSPEKMSFDEVRRLILSLKSYHIPVAKVIVNGIDQAHCEFCSKRHTRFMSHIDQFSKEHPDLEIITIPFFSFEIFRDTLPFLKNVLFSESKTQNVKLPASEINNLQNIRINPLILNPEIRLILVGGKGGVGKTSTSAAIAKHESKTRKVFLMSSDPAHSLSDIFEQPIGNKITSINNNLSALEISPHKRLEEIKTQYKKEINQIFSSLFSSSRSMKFDAPYERRVLEQLIDLSPPGIDEVMALQVLMNEMEKNDFDLYIMDTAPSGHTMRLLETPEMVRQWIESLLDVQVSLQLSDSLSSFMFSLLDAVNKLKFLLIDEKKTEFILVTIPTALSVAESNSLRKYLLEMNIGVKNVIINRIMPQLECTYCSHIRAGQEPYIKKINKWELNMVCLPLLKDEIGQHSIKSLEKAIFREN